MIRSYKVQSAIAVLISVGFALFVRPGEAQKPKSDKQPPPKPRSIGGLVPIVGHAVGFAETGPLRELIARNPQFDSALVGEGDEINELNSGDFGKPNPNAPPQKDGALQSSFPKGKRLN